jgi:hypothetical protein
MPGEVALQRQIGHGPVALRLQGCVQGDVGAQPFLSPARVGVASRVRR